MHTWEGLLPSLLATSLSSFGDNILGFVVHTLGKTPLPPLQVEMPSRFTRHCPYSWRPLTQNVPILRSLKAFPKLFRVPHQKNVGVSGDKQGKTIT